MYPTWVLPTATQLSGGARECSASGHSCQCPFPACVGACSHPGRWLQACWFLRRAEFSGIHCLSCSVSPALSLSIPGSLGDTQFSFRFRQSGGQRNALYGDDFEYNREAAVSLQVSCDIFRVKSKRVEMLGFSLGFFSRTRRFLAFLRWKLLSLLLVV